MTNNYTNRIITAYEYKPIKPTYTPPTRKSPAPTPRTAEAHKIKVKKVC